MARYEEGGPNLIRKVGGIFGGGGGGGGTTGGGDFADYVEQHPELFEEEGGKRATTFKPGQRPEQEPLLPRRLATYPHGYSYSQGRYPGGVPRYFDGDETLPAGLPPHNIAALQRLLVDSGLLENPRWGFWDRASEEAYQRALHESNGQGVDVQTLLTTYSDAAAAAEQEARGPYVPSEPLMLRTTNKEDLAKLFRDSSAKMLGIGWNDQQIRELVDAYNWQEIKVQQDVYNQNVAREKQLYETGTTDIDVINEANLPNPETFAENEAKRRDPGGFQAAQIGEQGGFADVFFDALGSRFG